MCVGASSLIEHAYRQGVPMVLITNQSEIYRELFKWGHFKRVNERIQEILGPNAPLAGVYAISHGPDAPADGWFKPSPQMLFQAYRDLNIDLCRSIIVGDRLSDLQTGDSAGLALVFHVLSGHASNARSSVVEWQHQQENISMVNRQSPHKSPKLMLLGSVNCFLFSLLEKGDVAS